MKGPIITFLLIVALAGLALWTASEHQTRAKLTAEHQTLAAQLEEMTQLKARNEQLSNLLGAAEPPQSTTDDQSRELLRLRGKVGMLRQQSQELESVRQENRQARAALDSVLKSPSTNAAKAMATADYWPQDSWAFKGYGSAEATLQSSLWAANNGNLKAFLQSITGDMRKMIEEDLNGKSETEAAIRAMDEVIGFKSVRVVNREIRSDDTMVLTVEMEGKTETKTESLLMKREGNDWKISGEP